MKSASDALEHIDSLEDVDQHHV